MNSNPGTLTPTARDRLQKNGMLQKGGFMQVESRSALSQIDPGTVAAESMAFGLARLEPLFFLMDGLLRYAKAYAAAHDSALASDGVLGPAWLKAATGTRALLDGQGAVAMEEGRSADSKDDGTIETMFCAAIRCAGYTEEDV